MRDQGVHCQVSLSSHFLRSCTLCNSFICVCLSLALTHLVLLPLSPESLPRGKRGDPEPWDSPFVTQVGEAFWQKRSKMGNTLDEPPRHTVWHDSVAADPFQSEIAVVIEDCARCEWHYMFRQYSLPRSVRTMSCHWHVRCQQPR